MQLFYDSNISKGMKTHQINAEESTHILKVLRKRIGDEVFITNGKGDLFKTLIVEVIAKKCIVEIENHQREERSTAKLHIAISPTKSSDRFEFFLEKATEIGIEEITPILTRNSERKHLNLKRCTKIIESAMKQSHRLYVPKLNPLTPLSIFLNHIDASKMNLIAHCEEDQKVDLSSLDLRGKSTCVMIGPEGDFDPQEIKDAFRSGFRPVSLGKQRLRTETAGVYVCSLYSIKDSLSFS